MPGKEEQIARDFINKLSTEELSFIAECLPDAVLCSELIRRYEANLKIANSVKEMVNKWGELHH